MKTKKLPLSCAWCCAIAIGLFVPVTHAGVLSLDGIDSWVSFENESGMIPVGDDPFTVEAWINPTGPTSGGAGGQITFWGEQAGNQSNGFRMRGPGGVRHYFWGNDHDEDFDEEIIDCLLYTSPSPRDDT